MNKTNRGITLVALVVTIVGLLILASVSLSLVVGQNGIITKAKESSKTYTEVTANEQEVLNEVEGYFNTVGGTNVPQQLPLPSTDITKPYYPNETFNRISGTDLASGLVIKDSKENEYVWVEVPMDKTNVYKTATSKTEYSKIESDLQNYVAIYRNIDYTDTWYDGCGIATETEYNNLKNKMLGSIYEHGGFWIGRYEAGCDSPRTSNGQTLTEVKTQKNLYPYNYVKQRQAQTQIAALSNGKQYNTSLLFGIQWDLTLKYMEEKGKIQEDLSKNSTNWGNYNNAQFNIVDRNAKYSIDNGANYLPITETYKKQAGGILLTTGASQRNSYMNIYDMAGNQNEITLEKDSNAATAFSVRRRRLWR